MQSLKAKPKGTTLFPSNWNCIAEPIPGSFIGRQNHLEPNNVRLMSGHQGKTYEAFSEQENTAHNEEKTQPSELSQSDTGDRLWGQGHYHTDGYVPTVAEARGKIERVSGDMESIKKTQVALLEMKTATPEIFNTQDGINDTGSDSAEGL